MIVSMMSIIQMVTSDGEIPPAPPLGTVVSVIPIAAVVDTPSFFHLRRLVGLW